MRCGDTNTIYFDKPDWNKEVENNTVDGEV